MIPILYSSTETAFTSNGIGRLRDCISAKVTEQRNGNLGGQAWYAINTGGVVYFNAVEGLGGSGRQIDSGTVFRLGVTYIATNASIE